MPNLIETLSEVLHEKNMKLVTAESCTGGLLSASITRQSGASNVFERGYVTYSNEAKIELLGVPTETIETHGAVSEKTAEAMALGALKNSHANLAVSITGIAGPDGGTDEKPIGTVYMGYALKNGSSGALKHNFTGTREDIQAQTTQTAIQSLIAILEKESD